jgi:hypothetical protein
LVKYEGQVFPGLGFNWANPRGDNDGGKKQLLSAEQQLEGKPNVSDAEKHIEGSLQALKYGDNNGAILHAQFAIDMLNK